MLAESLLSAIAELQTLNNIAIILQLILLLLGFFDGAVFFLAVLVCLGIFGCIVFVPIKKSTGFFYGVGVICIIYL